MMKNMMTIKKDDQYSLPCAPDINYLQVHHDDEGGGSGDDKDNDDNK